MLFLLPHVKQHLVLIKPKLYDWGGPTPFSPRHNEIWIWGWAKMGKKYMEREGNKLSIFKIEKIPIFSHDAPKFGFGDGKKCEKMGEKVYGKRGKKYSF